MLRGEEANVKHETRLPSSFWFGTMGEEQLTNKIDNTSRKKWDTAEFAKRAQDRDNKDAQLENETAKQRRNREKKERDPLHMGLILHRSNLKARDFEVDLTSRLGKTQMVGMGASLSEQVMHCLNSSKY